MAQNEGHAECANAGVGVEWKCHEEARVTQFVHVLLLSLEVIFFFVMI